MIQLVNVSKAYPTGEMALDNISLAVDPGEFLFLVGPSGSGKTTLLRMLIRDMVPSSGSVLVNEWDLVKLPKNKIPKLRRNIGVIFQDLKLLSDMTIFENILLPLHIAQLSDKEATEKVHAVMEQVGIAQHRNKFPIQLSGGELQRAAIARALVFSPKILLADEPTGNLDMATSWEIVKLLQDINQKGTTVLMATHNTDIVNNLVRRVVSLEKGKLIQDSKKEAKSEEKHEVKKEDKPEPKPEEKHEEKHAAKEEGK